MIPLVEPLVDLLAQAEGIHKTVLAGSPLAGDHGTHQRARSSGLQIVLRQKRDDRIDIFIGNTLNFHGQPGSHGDLPAAEALRRLRDGTMLLGCNLSVLGDHPDIEHIPVPFILKAAQPLHPLDLLRGQLSSRGNPLLDHIEAGSAFQDLRIYKAQRFQLILCQISSLAPCAY